MGRVKEHYINGLPENMQDDLTGHHEPIQRILDDMSEREKTFMSALIYQLGQAVKSGELDEGYAGYLVMRPVEGAIWLEDYMGVNI